MILNFLYSERCTREVKLIASVITCAVIYACSSIEKLSTALTLLCLMLGASLHILRILSLKVPASQLYAQGFKYLLVMLPLLGLAWIIFTLPAKHWLYSAVQALGFMSIGLLLPLIYQNRAKRFE